MKKAVFGPAEILLPEEAGLNRWAVLACDQFTSEPEYWQQAEAYVGAQPSTLRIVLPEVYLEEEGTPRRIQDIHAAMEEYLQHTLTRKVQGYVYVERTFEDGSVRQGLVGMVDLEEYAYEKGAKPRIRPSENTVVERIPPRLAVRRNACLESPHILMLADDPAQTIIEPLAAQKASLPLLYDTELMLGGGHICGWAVTEPGLLQQVENALAALEAPARFIELYGTSPDEPPFALAVGDGNHSLATAKAAWEEMKPTLSQQEKETHPARFCLVELENIQSPANVIEPIHRVIFGAQPGIIEEFAEFVKQTEGAVCAPPQSFVLLQGTTETTITAQNPVLPIAAATAEAFIEQYCAARSEVRIDYVHGDDSVRQLVAQGAAGILLPDFEKKDLFRGVALGGVLPKKTFSMGHATQKRYYLECRKIIK